MQTPLPSSRGRSSRGRGSLGLVLALGLLTTPLCAQEEIDPEAEAEAARLAQEFQSDKAALHKFLGDYAKGAIRLAKDQLQLHQPCRTHGSIRTGLAQ